MRTGGNTKDASLENIVNNLYLTGDDSLKTVAGDGYPTALSPLKRVLYRKGHKGVEWQESLKI